MDGWRYYNHAALPTCAPHEEPELRAIETGAVWKMEGRPLLARWTSEWDLPRETQWWYVIKDTPFDIDSLKSNRRYKITKGKKYFDVREIEPGQYIEELFRITVEAYTGWPEKYRPRVEPEQFRKTVLSWGSSIVVFAAFDRETGNMRGYSQLTEYASYVDLNVLRTEPAMERLQVNAALVAGILEAYNGRLSSEFYMLDGSRAIWHETAFQDYLEKYFGFRKAYCRLHIRYRRDVGLLVRLLYPFRSRIRSDTGFGSQLTGILKMEEIARSSAEGRLRYE